MYYYVLRTFMYSPIEDLKLSNFPKNMCLTFKKNMILRRLQFDPGKLTLVNLLRTNIYYINLLLLFINFITIKNNYILL